MALKNGKSGASYPDKSKVRKKMSAKQRLEALEADHTVTEMRVDAMVNELQRLRTCLAKKARRIRKQNGAVKQTMQLASVED